MVAEAWVPFRRPGPLWRASFGTGPGLLQLEPPTRPPTNSPKPSPRPPSAPRRRHHHQPEGLRRIGLITHPRPRPQPRRPPPQGQSPALQCIRNLFNRMLGCLHHCLQPVSCAGRRGRRHRGGTPGAEHTDEARVRATIRPTRRSARRVGRSVIAVVTRPWSDQCARWPRIRDRRARRGPAGRGWCSPSAHG